MHARRAGALAALALAATLVATGTATAALRFSPCAAGSRARCATLAVPLDRSGSRPGTVRLRIARLPARGRSRGALVALAGGPGQAALPFVSDFGQTLRPALAHRDLIVLDQRGTGDSGLLRCPGVERAKLPELTDAGAACAARLGADRGLYTTRDSVEDIEAVRRALGVRRLALYGVSYGTKVAAGYAVRHPEHVERIVLDSVVPLGGPDPLYRATFAAVPRALRILCRHDGCRGVTRDPVGDLATLVASVGGGSLAGAVAGRDGRARPASVTTVDVFGLVLAGDLNPQMRLAVPSAVRGALAGDPAPLLRLAAATEAAEGGDLTPRQFSSGLFAATTCEEAPLPWSRELPLAARPAAVTAALDAVPAGRWAPFDRTVAAGSDVLALCLRWPLGDAAPDVGGGPLPDVPTLVLSGEWDLRTPLGDARASIAGARRATLLRVPGVGHSVAAYGEPCVDRALGRFFAGAAVPRCSRPRGAERVVPLAPRSLERVVPDRRVPAVSGRAVGAAVGTVSDMIRTYLIAAVNGASPAALARGLGGLRGGRFSVARGRYTLERYAYVPGVAVSGGLDLGGDFATGRLTIAGPAAARGSLTFRADGRVDGRLGGRRVRFRSRAL